MFASFGLGLAIVLSPCAYFLFPVVLITLFSDLNTQKGLKRTSQRLSIKHLNKILMFFIGFVLGGILIVLFSGAVGHLLAFKSIKLLLGMLFVGAGVYAYFQNINGIGLQFPKLGIIGLGFSIPIVSSISGCGLPFLASAVAIMSSSTWIWNVLSFLLGMILPYLIVVLAGDWAINLIKSFNKRYYKLNHWITPLLFVVTGIYTIFSVFYINPTDMTQLLILIIIVFAIICYLLCKKYVRTRGWTIALLVLSATLAYVFWYLILQVCQLFSRVGIWGPLEKLTFLRPYIGVSEHTCTNKVSYCPYCLTCNIVFVVASIITAYAYLTIKMLVVKRSVKNK